MTESSTTVYFLDGTHETMFGNQEEFMQNIIRERLGSDCEELYNQIIADAHWDKNQGDDYEAISEGYLESMREAVEELEELIKHINYAQRLNKPTLNVRLGHIKAVLLENI